MRRAAAMLLAMMGLAASALLAPAAALAGEAAPLAADPALEARVMALAGELRCVVCQNETLAASQADLARDLRAQVREQLRAGRSPQEVVDFMVARYGQFVLYRPPLQATTVALWAGPFALLALAAGAMALRLRRRGGEVATGAAGTALSAEERQRVEQLLREPGTRA